MTPPEIIKKLQEIYDIKISRTTLLRYERQGLIPKPTRGAGGQVVGRWTQYPDETIAEAYASWCLQNGKYEKNYKKHLNSLSQISPEYIKEARKTYYFKKPFQHDTTLESLESIKTVYDLFVFGTWKYHYEYALKEGANH